jgi:hypothetical protein
MVPSVAKHALAFLKPRVGRVFQLTKDALFETADVTESADEQRAAFEGAQCLHSHRDRLLERFSDEFLKGFDSHPAPSRRTAERVAESGALSHVELVNDEALDLSVAVSTVTSRSASRHKSHLDRIMPALDQRLRTNRRNPLSVFRITGCFMTAVSTVQLDASIQRLLLGVFEREVIDNLGLMYGQVCEILNIDLSADGATVTGQSHLQAPPGRPADPRRSTGGGALEFEALRDLMHRPGAAWSPGGYSSGSAPAGSVSTREFVAVLDGIDWDDLQRSAGSADLYTLAGDALSRSGVQVGQVEEVAQDTLRLVSMLFEHLLKDDALSMPVVSLLSRLQIPVLKVALADPGLFDDHDHVVRRVINRLAGIGIGIWGDTERVRDDPLYQAIDRVVSRIVEDCHSDPAAFDFADQTLMEITDKHVGRAGTLEKRVNERESGRAKLRAARRVVQSVLNSRASGLRLPVEVSTFLRDDWAQVMVYLCIRHGTDSDPWQAAVVTLTDLLDLGQPAGRDHELTQRIEKLPSVLERVEHWMQVAGNSASTTEAHVSRLYDAIRGLQEQDEIWLNSASSYDVDELPEMNLIELVPADDDATLPGAESGATEGAGLQPGVWVEFVSGGQPRNRCKLSMVFEQSGNHLFVDHRGFRVCELTAFEVRRLLEAGELRELQADPVVERAIDEMIAELKASLKAGGAV